MWYYVDSECLILCYKECNEFRFTAHKVVLAATIPYFNGMFLSNMSECIKNEISIHGLDAWYIIILENFLVFWKFF